MVRPVTSPTHRMDHPPTNYLLPRGVWWARALSRDGHPIAVAVDSRGRIVAHEVVTDSESSSRVTARLRAKLDRVDGSALEVLS